MRPAIRRRIRQWELIGAAVIAVAGVLLHYVFAWTGGAWLVALFGAVNESVWEHLKLLYWPVLFYAVVEHRRLGPIAANFVVAKAASIYVMLFTVIGGFYGYVAIFKANNLIADIGLFFAAIILGQYTSYKIMTMPRLSQNLRMPAFFLLFVLGASFLVFTLHPPHLSLFRDMSTGGYGIP